MKASMFLLFVLFVNVLLFLGQTSIDKISTDGTQFFNYEGSWLEARDSGNFTLNEELSGVLPESQSTVEVTDGNIFTDTWRTLKTWLTDKIPGFDFLGRVVNGPSSFLKAAGLPSEISFAIGWFWHILSIFIFVSWIRGGSS